MFLYACMYSVLLLFFVLTSAFPSMDSEDRFFFLPSLESLGFLGIYQKPEHPANITGSDEASNVSTSAANDILTNTSTNFNSTSYSSERIVDNISDNEMSAEFIFSAAFPNLSPTEFSISRRFEKIMLEDSPEINLLNVTANKTVFLFPFTKSVVIKNDETAPQSPLSRSFPVNITFELDLNFCKNITSILPYKEISVACCEMLPLFAAVVRKHCSGPAKRHRRFSQFSQRERKDLQAKNIGTNDELGHVRKLITRSSKNIYVNENLLQQIDTAILQYMTLVKSETECFQNGRIPMKLFKNSKHDDIKLIRPLSCSVLKYNTQLKAFFKFNGVSSAKTTSHCMHFR